MTVTWSLDKRQRLHTTLTKIMERKPSDVAPWGTFLSFNLENSLRKAHKNAFAPGRKWWNRSKIYLHLVASNTIRQLLETLLAPEGDPRWTRPIYLYLDRDPTHAAYSDASYAGLGGWSPDFKFYWRLTRQDLIDHGFPMKIIDNWSTEPTHGNNEGLHINPLEFIAALINLWIALVLIRSQDPRSGGFVLQLISDNTTALSWMSIASRTPDQTLQGLARLERHRGRSQPTISTATGVRQLTGIRYQQMVPTADMSSLPLAFQLVANDCIRDFITTDRGEVRAHNDKTFDSRATFFVDWCAEFDINEEHLRHLDTNMCLILLATYAREVSLGTIIDSCDDLMASTIKLYMTAAHRVLEVIHGRPIDILDPHGAGKSRNYHPLIGQQIADRRKWNQPKPKKLPYTGEMFEVLRQLVSDHSNGTQFLSREHATYDWQRLGLFTGFRIGEYGQSRLRKGHRYSTIPNEAHVPPHQRGLPLAFLISDFKFYDHKHREIHHSEIWDRYLKGDIRLVEITWRYDKSPTNFSVRRYLATGHQIFDPLAAAVCIVHRAVLLKVPLHEPMGVWSSNGQSYKFLKDTDVAFVMRAAVIGAYPDPAHYMRQHIHQIVPHSNCVTAAVSLKQGGASNDDIAYRLRWIPKSVPTYLRNCFGAVNADLAKALNGSMAFAFA